MNERILVIEDNDTLANLMRLQLEHAGYQVSVCHDGPSGVREAQSWKPDLILLDILLPTTDGWVTCEQLKSITNAPIIFTTALGTDKHLIRGLELGADDYIIKPFTRKELLNRIRATLFRSRRGAARKAVYRNNRLFVDLNTHTVKVAGVPIALTPLEYKLLEALVEQAGQVVPHAVLLRHAWGPGHEEQRNYLKLYIRYLRQKIEADPDHPTLILSARGAGYCLAPPEQNLQG